MTHLAHKQVAEQGARCPQPRRLPKVFVLELSSETSMCLLVLCSWSFQKTRETVRFAACHLWISASYNIAHEAEKHSEELVAEASVFGAYRIAHHKVEFLRQLSQMKIQSCIFSKSIIKKILRKFS